MTTARLTRRDGWLALTFGLAAAAVTADAWADIYRLGTMREELSYVLLAPAVIAWVAWERRDRLADCPVRGGWAGVIVLALGWLAFWYGYWTDPVVWRGGTVLLTVGAVLTIVGLPAAWRLWPAFGAAVFLIPISPDGRYQIATPLQTATAAATQTVCDVIGMDVARAGNLLSTNGVDVTIAEACNGLRMVFTLLLVCYAVAFTGTARWWLGLPMVLLSPLVAVLANVVRLVPTVWVFGHASAESAETFHSAAGWVMTFVAFVVLSGVVRAVDWAIGTAPSTPPRASLETPADAALATA